MGFVNLRHCKLCPKEDGSVERSHRMQCTLTANSLTRVRRALWQLSTRRHQLPNRQLAQPLLAGGPRSATMLLLLLLRWRLLLLLLRHVVCSSLHTWHRWSRHYRACSGCLLWSRQ